MSAQPPPYNDLFSDEHDDLLSHWCSEIVDGEPSGAEFDALLGGIANTRGGRRKLLLHLLLDSQLRNLLRQTHPDEDRKSDRLST